MIKKKTGADGADAPEKKGKPRKSDAARAKTLSAVAGAAVAIAIFSAGYGIWTSVAAQSAIDAARVGTAPTLMAKTGIKAGDALDASMLAEADVPQAFRADGALDATALAGEGAIAGRLALVDIAPGTQITPSMVAGSGAASALSAALGEGTEAVSIAVDAESGVAGTLRQGDTVRIISLVPAASGEAVAETIAQGVRVVALDSALAGADGTYTSVTVEVSPDVATAVRAAQHAGSVSLALEPRVG